MTITDFSNVLAEHPFFSGMASEHISALAGCVANVVFEPGELLFREGDAAERFYVVRFGRVSVETHAPNRAHLPIETADAGRPWSGPWPWTECASGGSASATP
jgi:CRP/FNR family transcriptional regulator, cyclic AMP receptor protein